MRPELWLSFKYLQKHKKTPAFFISIVAVLGVMVGVAALIIVISVMNGFDKNLKEKLLGFNYHLTAYVSSADYAAAEKIRAVPGVENAVLISQVQTAVKKGKVIAPAVMTGIAYDEREIKYWNRYLQEGDFSSLALGRVLMDRLGLEVGDTIDVLNPDTLKPEGYTVSGCFEVGMYDLDTNIIALPIKGHEAFFNTVPEAWAVGVRLKDPEQASKIRDVLYGRDFESVRFVRTWYEYNKTLFSALNLERLTMFIILSLIVLVASFNIFATQTVRVVEKIKDVGILKTIGINGRGIGLLFCMQGVVIGAVGVLLGVGAGIGLCWVVAETDLIRLPPEIYYIDRLPVQIETMDVVYICSIALAMSFVFSIFPAMKAASIKEVDALKYE